jgi:mono/diheme cytochrome c family protein/plastocyanin
MTDQTGRPAEERLSAQRQAPAPAPAARIAAPPPAHRNELTPERAARIVRQSASARWVGFLAVTIVGLFVIGYYFYELGLPGGMSEPRLDAATKQQQVTAVERGYNIFQANCAQCHGVNGEGGKGPTLNRQDKLFAHLSPEYIRNMLQVGGRYACGNAASIMPIWSNTGNPPGPLNYKQIDNLIAFIRAQKGTTYRVLDPNLFEPVVDPATGKEVTFEGWVDPAYQPQPGATPYPACWLTEFTNPGASASPGGSPAASPGASASPGGSPAASASPGATAAPGGTVLTQTAINFAFGTKELAAPADASFQIEFDNQESGVQHNIEIRDANNTVVFTGQTITGPSKITYTVPALPAGAYTFACTIHPNMTGTLKVGG